MLVAFFWNQDIGKILPGVTKMNAMQSVYRGMLKAAVAPALLYAATGCASIGEVRELRQNVANLETRVSGVEKRPFSESPVFLSKGKGYDETFGRIIGVLLNKYKDPKSKKKAEKFANSVYLMPTNKHGSYTALVIRDMDGNGRLTPGVDRVYTDKQGGKEIESFEIREGELPHQVLLWLDSSAKPIGNK